MNISWGTKIAILYTGFVVLIVSLVGASMFKKVDLVSDDYYHQETIYQQRLDATNAGNELSEPLSISTNKTIVMLQFPSVFRGKSLHANIHFYAASNSSADRIFDLQTDEGLLNIEKAKLAKAPYEVQVSWNVNGKEFYQSLPLNLLAP